MRGTIRKRGDGYEFATRLDTSDVDQRQLKRAGYVRRKDADAGLRHVVQLVELAGADDRLRRRIGDMIFAARYGRPLPSVEEVRRRLGAGREPDARSYTVGEWLDTWLAECGGHLQAGTYDGHATTVRVYLRPHLGDVMLDKLDSRAIRGMFDWLNARNDVVRQARETGGLVPFDPLDVRRRVQVVDLGTQGKILNTLRTALNVAANDDHRLIDRNPAARFKLPRAQRKSRTWWSTEQVNRFLKATYDDRLHALWRVALLRGLRRGELLALTWADVDLDAGRLHVRAGKTEAAQRTVSLDPGSVTVLREHRRRQLEERVATFGAYDDHDLVFAQEDGTPIPGHRVTLDFQRLAHRHGLPRMRFHDTRHTAASIALESGIDIKVVSDQLGHSSTRITLDTYQHVLRRLHDDAAARVAAAVDGA
jgi:integrase